ncbi:MAG: hypothetical protein IPJ88_12880 [Myxococcales bacterium]|nr:MAG: hypothetical protein IPJ88_12880 [Myxococcales bacterium]
MFAAAYTGLVTSVFGFSLSFVNPGLPELGAATPSSLFAVQASADGEGDQSGEDVKNEEEEAYFKALDNRAELAKWHRILGIATWGSMALTTVFGAIQYYNLYGVFAGQGSNPCVEGNAVFGQSQCSGTPALHAVSAGLTAGLYYTTFTLSLLMPDPDDASAGQSEFAKNIRTHKWLRWIHFGGMAVQAVLGIVSANGELLGLDRANDYGTLQAISTVHLTTGLITLGALSWAALLML